MLASSKDCAFRWSPNENQQIYIATFDANYRNIKLTSAHTSACFYLRIAHSECHDSVIMCCSEISGVNVQLGVNP